MTLRAAALALAALGIVATAGATRAADPGVTASTVLLGGTVPLTDEAAAFGTVAPGAKAYFDHVNATGGVHGRKIEYRHYDDAYNPAQTVQLTRRLVELDEVFAIFNSVGTANNLSVRDYLNAQKVPQLFAGDGSQSIGRSFARYDSRRAQPRLEDAGLHRKDKAVALYRSIMRRHNPSGKSTDVYNWYGMAVAWTMVETLRKAGRNLTRAGLLRAAQALDTREGERDPPSEGMSPASSL